MERKLSTLPVTPFNSLAIARGLTWSIIIALLGCALLAIASSYIQLKENIQPVLLYIINGASAFIGGAFAGGRARTSGWLHGGLVGAIYVLVLFLILNFTTEMSVGMSVVFARTAAGFILGAIGGIMGVNRG